jgi:hypothetical protein
MAFDPDLITVAGIGPAVTLRPGDRLHMDHHGRRVLVAYLKNDEGSRPTPWSAWPSGGGARPGPGGLPGRASRILNGLDLE